MADRHSKWMALSSMTGFALFMIANFTDVFVGLNVLAGLLQLLVNAFVFITWGRAFLDRRGLRRAFATFGVVIPLIVAGITIYRVLWPFVLLSVSTISISAL